MIDRLERLINLVIALRETRRPLGAEEIRQRVAGYGHDEYESFRRMFERDKADLRRLGVPVEAVAIEFGEAVEGYRIDPESYDLPAAEFDDEELAALAVAVQATGLADVAGTGIRKLEVARGGGRDAPDPLSGADPVVAVALDEPHRSVLTDAQITRTRVRFSYRPADGGTSTRTVEPHGMVFRRGHWYVVGRDAERQAVRSFRLDRIEGTVRTTGRAAAFVPPPGELDVSAVLPSDEDDRLTAVLAARDVIAWKVARRATGEGRRLPDGRTAYEVTDRPASLERWMLEDGPDVELIEPPWLRRRIHRHLAAVLAQVDPGVGQEDGERG